MSTTTITHAYMEEAILCNWEAKLTPVQQASQCLHSSPFYAAVPKHGYHVLARAQAVGGGALPAHKGR